MAAAVVGASRKSDADKNSSEAPFITGEERSALIALLDDVQKCALSDAEEYQLNTLLAVRDKLIASGVSVEPPSPLGDSTVVEAIAHYIEAGDVMGAFGSDTLQHDSGQTNKMETILKLIASAVRSQFGNEAPRSSDAIPNALRHLDELRTLLWEGDEGSETQSDAWGRVVQVMAILEAAPGSKEPSQDARLREAVRIIRTLEWRKGYCLTCQHMEPGKHSADCPVGVFLGTGNTESDEGSTP